MYFRMVSESRPFGLSSSSSNMLFSTNSKTKKRCPFLVSVLPFECFSELYYVFLFEHAQYFDFSFGGFFDEFIFVGFFEFFDGN